MIRARSLALLALTACAPAAPSVRADVAPLAAGLAGQEDTLERLLADELRARQLDRCDCDWTLDAEAREGGMLAAARSGSRVSTVHSVLEASCVDRDERFEHEERAIFGESGADGGRRAAERATVERAIRVLTMRASVIISPRCPIEASGSGDGD